MKIALIILSVVTVIAIALGVTGVVVASKAIQQVNEDGISTPFGSINRGDMIARMADRIRDNRGGMMDGTTRRGPGMQGGWDDDDTRGGMMGRGGMVARGDGLLHDVMVAAFAEKIGLTVEEINTKLDAGETMRTIAEAQGITAADLPQLIIDVRTAALEKAVADGTITQAQADAMKARREARGDGLLHDAYVAAFAEKIGLTVEEINTKLEAGETMWTIAEAQGIAAADLPQLITDVHTAALEKAVADGTITQAQADAMRARREARGGFGAGCPGVVEPTEAPAN